MSKEILLTLFGTAVGTAMGFLLNDFSPGIWTHWIILLIIALIAFGALSLTGPIKLILKMPTPIAKIAGTWKTTWSYEKNSGTVSIESKMDLKQIGCYIWGEGLSTKITGPHDDETVRYKVKARVSPDGIVDGNWVNEERCQYYGHFIGKIHRGGKQVFGKFLGTADGIPHSGPWEWSKNIRNG